MAPECLFLKAIIALGAGRAIRLLLCSEMIRSLKTQTRGKLERGRNNHEEMDLALVPIVCPSTWARDIQTNPETQFQSPSLLPNCPMSNLSRRFQLLLVVEVHSKKTSEKERRKGNNTETFYIPVKYLTPLHPYGNT